MSLVRRPTLRWAAVSWSLVTPQRFIQYSTACRSERSSRSLSMKPRLSFRPAMGVLRSAFDEPSGAAILPQTVGLDLGVGRFNAAAARWLVSEPRGDRRGRRPLP